MTRLVVLDNEAVQALLDAGHSKHRRALSIVAVVAARKRRTAAQLEVVVPAAVRAEAGWDRTATTAALIDRLSIRDAVLDGAAADVCATLVRAHRVSVPDAHVGAVVRARHASVDTITVVSSDPADVRTVVGALPATIIRI